MDGLNIQANKASFSFDQRHLLEVSYIYRLPLEALWHGARNAIAQQAIDVDYDAQDNPSGPKAVATDPQAAAFLDNWDLSGLTLAQSGSPFSVYNAGYNGIAAIDNAGVANGSRRSTRPIPTSSGARRQAWPPRARPEATTQAASGHYCLTRRPLPPRAVSPSATRDATFSTIRIAPTSICRC